MPCKKRFFRLSSSYLYFFHILTIMCCQNKIFPRFLSFSVENTGGVSSCSTGKRKPAGHGHKVRSLPAKYSWINRKRDGEGNGGQRGAPHTVIPVHTSVKGSVFSCLPVCTRDHARPPSPSVPSSRKGHSVCAGASHTEYLIHQMLYFVDFVLSLHCVKIRTPLRKMY